MSKELRPDTGDGRSLPCVRCGVTTPDASYQDGFPVCDNCAESSVGNDEPMDDLIAFLRARLDEDELVARLAHESRPGPWGMRGDVYGTIEIYSVQRDRDHGRDSNVVPDAWHNESTTHITRWDPARVLAEVEAKRRILALHEVGNEPLSGRPVCCRCIEAPTGGLDWDWPCLTICLLALPHAEHPDYRAEWRP